MCQGCYWTWTKLLDQWTDEFFPQTKVCVIKIEFFPFLPVLNILPVVVQASFYMDQDLIVYNGNKWSQGARFDGQTAVAAGWGRCFHFHCYHFHFYWHLAMFFAIFLLFLHSFRFASFKESKEQSPRLREVELKVSAKRCFLFLFWLVSLEEVKITRYGKKFLLYIVSCRRRYIVWPI